MRHMRFSPQSGEKPREFNVLLRTHAPQQTASLFNHLVGAGEQRRRDFEAERFGGFKVNQLVRPCSLYEIVRSLR